MKLLAFILAFLILAQSVVPCSDKENCHNKSKISIQLTQACSHSSNSSPDECSPFCQCSCCAGFSINHFIVIISPAHVVQMNEYSSELSSSTFNLSLPIWQPPQLV